MTTPNTDAPIALEEGGPLDNSVTFANDEAPPSQRKTASQLRSAKDRASLSQSAKAWDLDGDGELDDAELALKNMDKRHTGTLNKDQMYKLMAENLNTQRELFKVKKVVIGLVVFAAILAISNLGTSLAAAFLAKDTKSTDSKLTDSKSGRTLGTANTIEHFDIDKEYDEDHSRRRLIDCTETSTGNGQNKVTSTSCTGFNGNAIPATEAHEIIDACDGGQSVSVVKHFGDGTSTVPHDICRISTFGYGFDGGIRNRNRYHKMTITRPTGTVVIQPDDADSTGDTYLVTGLVSAAGLSCDENTDCASGLRCDGASLGVAGTCVLKSVFGEFCAVDDDCSFQLACDTDTRTCKGDLRRPCGPTNNGDDCANLWACVEYTTPWQTVQSTCQCISSDTCGTGEHCIEDQIGQDVCECNPADVCANGGTCTDECGRVDAGKACYTNDELDGHCWGSDVCTIFTGYSQCGPPLGEGRE